jgi:hypothetical protein
VVLYHNIVVAHGGQRDFDDCMILRLRVSQCFPVMETISSEIDPMGVLSLDQCSSFNHGVQACFSKPGTHGCVEKASGHPRRGEGSGGHRDKQRRQPLTLSWVNPP